MSNRNFEDKSIVKFGTGMLSVLNDHIEKYGTQRQFELLSPKMRNKLEMCFSKKQDCSTKSDNNIIHTNRADIINTFMVNSTTAHCDSDIFDYDMYNIKNT